jgi:hypothetical protein
MRRHARTHRAAWVIALSFALTVLAAIPASAATPTMTASLTTPNPANGANAGAQTTFTLTVKSNQGSLRSLTLAAPTGFFVGSATSTSGNPNVSGNQTVSVTGLNISGSNTVTVTITAWPQCTPDSPNTPPNTWTLNASQNGGTTYVPVTFSTTVNPSSSCKLVFGPIADQLTVPPALTTTPVSVTVTRANGSTDTTFTGPISLSIEVDPGKPDDATLTGGGTPTTYVNGVATFSTSLDVAGTGYRLEACNPTVNGEACDSTTGDGGQFLSGIFAVYNQKTDCEQGKSCFANASIAQQVATQVTANSQNGKSVKAGIFSVPQSLPGSLGDLSLLDCAGYDEITEVVASFDFNGDGTKTVVNTVSAEQMKEIANNGVSYLQTCFGSSLPFTDRFNNPAVFDPTLGLFVGLLKDCATNKKNPVAPCIVSRQGGGAGTGLITYIAADKDPGGARH